MNSKLSYKIAVTTLGCKVNQYESAGIIEKLAGSGFINVPFNNSADMYIINTCTVTARTDYQSRQLIRKAYRNNPKASIIVTGCYAQRAPGDLSGLPGVAAVVGNAEKEDIPDIIRNMVNGEQQILVGTIGHVKNISGFPVTRFPEHTRAFLRIQDGCNSFCSYCIVPYLRGRSRSLPEKDVLDRIGILGKAGHREIVLSGIHLGVYGEDLSPPASLLTLLKKIEENKTVERLRLSSIEPTEVTDEMISHIRDSKIICPHLHIPFQSGDNKILSLMKRDYNTKLFRGLIEKLLNAIPDIALGIDVMVGFPGEGEKEFANTVAFIEEIPVAYLHVFRYSKRPGTRSSALPGEVAEDVKKERSKILRLLGKEKRAAFAERFIGKSLSVLIEDKKDRDTGLQKGFSENYIPVLITENTASLANNIVAIIADKRDGGKLLGRKIAHG
ncbi:MAG: tRNA (N(6)-L-threonylcarbamoyladenosine(37)-C(2))-methylthiotransferase MtaB [Syntrophales bacterium]|nr:tRNA (N(6)-L-threonylcarbamoyladenosine(37)-C(2))-methylthiotransferase MtaB [Syntrophales bacterium]